jgi:hypothetical protein
MSFCLSVNKEANLNPQDSLFFLICLVVLVTGSDAVRGSSNVVQRRHVPPLDFEK